METPDNGIGNQYYFVVKDVTDPPDRDTNEGWCIAFVPLKGFQWCHYGSSGWHSEITGETVHPSCWLRKIDPRHIHKVIEMRKLLLRIEKTFGVLDELVETLKSAKKNDLPEAVKVIDIDFKLMQAEIKDTIR